MYRFVVVAAIANLVLPTTSAVAVEGPLVLTPVSAWQMDYGEERCSLLRDFAAGEHHIGLRIEAYGPLPGYRVTLAGDLVAGSDARPIDLIRVAYSPDTHVRQPLQLFAGKIGNQPAVAFGPAFLPDARWDANEALAFERAVDSITISFQLRRPFKLETGSMAAPFEAMRKCVDDLVVAWGLDPAAQRTRTQAPMLLKPPPGYELVRVNLANDHPVYTERRYQTIARAQAAAREKPVVRTGFATPVRVMIDADGTVTACVAQGPAVSEAERKSVCDTLRGPYQPALDAEGRPIASFVQTGL
jgi:hypothetical protein